MNKLLPILLVVVLGACSKSFVHINGDNDFDKFLKAQHECSAELGGGVNVSCSAIRACLRTKGWMQIDSSEGIVVPSDLNPRCVN
jgi:hypothetical protein